MPGLELVAPLVAAVAFRIPALLHPWGWVNRDGAYGAFVALHLVQGLRPAPVFTEGANYQGTLKSHVAALLWTATGLRDLSLLMETASLLLYLVFIAASVSLARRIGGRYAGLFCGLYLALSPRFLTVFSLNCVGQYVDVLALGGCALALCARLLERGDEGRDARGTYLAIGVLLGAAFWQQPVAVCYALGVALVLALRRATWRDPWTLLVAAGALLGVLPVLLWNARHGWATGEIVGRDASEVEGQMGALLVLLRRTATVAFPILAGLSPAHPGRRVALVVGAATLLLPLTLCAYLAWALRRETETARRGRPGAALLALAVPWIALAIFWTVAAGRVYSRPRYLLPVLALAAVQMGVLLALLWTRSRVEAAALFALVIALNATGSWPRLRHSADVAAPYVELVRALEDKGIRTGYADFSVAAPVTMFTAEAITLSPALGPTPAYESEPQAARVARDGPDAYVLRAGDDPAAMAGALDRLGVRYTLTPQPVPIFHGLSRRVPLAELLPLLPDASGNVPPEE
jgi:hypothetical protein